MENKEEQWKNCTNPAKKQYGPRGPTVHIAAGLVLRASRANPPNSEGGVGKSDPNAFCPTKVSLQGHGFNIT